MVARLRNGRIGRAALHDEETLGGLDVLLLAYGALGDQGELQNDQNATAKLIRTNFVSAAA